MKYSNLIVPAIALIAPAFVSCAGGPSYAETKAKLPPPPKGHGRVFVYRTSTFGMAVKPSVKIDDKVVGTSEARGFVYSDQPAGIHKVSLATEWKHTASVSVKAGQSSFVQSQMRMGVFVGQIAPYQVENVIGEEEIQECKLSELGE